MHSVYSLFQARIGSAVGQHLGGGLGRHLVVAEQGRPVARHAVEHLAGYLPPLWLSPHLAMRRV